MDESRENSSHITDTNKRTYFINLGRTVYNAFQAHQEQGLQDRNTEGAKDWGNVSEHCLVEVARVKALGKAIGLSEETIMDLKTAAMLHDFFKKEEKSIVTAEGLHWESFEHANEQADQKLREYGFNEKVIGLTNAVGHSSLVETENILHKADLSEQDKAFLILHYTDDYTIGTDWVTPVERQSPDENDLDIRINKNEANPRYIVINQEAKEHLQGRTLWQAQRTIGHTVERRLADLLDEKGTRVSPLKLPEYVDSQIKSEISQKI